MRRNQWAALLDAALDQPNPTTALRMAITDLQRRSVPKTAHRSASTYRSTAAQRAFASLAAIQDEDDDLGSA